MSENKITIKSNSTCISTMVSFSIVFGRRSEMEQQPDTSLSNLLTIKKNVFEMGFWSMQNLKKNAFISSFIIKNQKINIKVRKQIIYFSLSDVYANKCFDFSLSLL